MSYPLLLTLVVASAGGAQDRWEERTFNRTFSASGINRLSANIAAGSIRIVPDRSNEIRVHIVRKAKGGTAERRRWYLDGGRVVAEVRGGTLHVEEKLPKDDAERRNWEGNVSMGAEAEIRVPARLALDLTTGAGNVDVSRTEGALKVRTGAGNVELRDIRNSNDRVEVTTGAGNVNVGGRIGDLRVDTGAGHVRLNRLDAEGRSVEVTVGAGEIEATFDRVPSSNVQLSTGVGSVRVTAPKDSRSRVISDTDRDRDRRKDYSVGSKLVGEIGRTRVNLSTSVGSVSMITRSR